VFSVLTANTHYVYWALGHTRVVAIITAVGAIVVIPVTILCSHLLGFKGVALAYAVTNAFLVPVNFAMMWRLVGVKFTGLLFHTWRVSIGALVMLGALYFTFPGSAHEVASAAAILLAIKVSIGVIIYFATTALLWLVTGRPEGPENWVMQLVLQWLHSRELAAQARRSPEAP
jgi:O-antigen/teichoic acid export membrane protein